MQTPGDFPGVTADAYERLLLDAKAHALTGERIALEVVMARDADRLADIVT